METTRGPPQKNRDKASNSVLTRWPGLLKRKTGHPFPMLPVVKDSLLHPVNNSLFRPNQQRFIHPPVHRHLFLSGVHQEKEKNPIATRTRTCVLKHGRRSSIVDLTNRIVLCNPLYCIVSQYVTGFAKRDHIPQKFKIELATPRYCT